MWGEPNHWRPEDHLRIEHPGIRVFDVALPGRLQGCIDHESGIIWLDVGLGPAEWRSTLAYEIGQLQQGPTPQDSCLAAAHQRQAMDWAARMLVDAEDLFEAFGQSSDLAEIAARLEVDLPMLRARFRCLSDAEQDELMEAINQRRLSA
jgi:hypothetical protein